MLNEQTRRPATNPCMCGCVSCQRVGRQKSRMKRLLRVWPRQRENATRTNLRVGAPAAQRSERARPVYCFIPTLKVPHHVCAVVKACAVSRARQGLSVPCKLQQPSAGSKIVRRADAWRTTRIALRPPVLRHALPSTPKNAPSASLELC